MKFRLPRNCGGVSHAGRRVGVAADASVELDEAELELLRPHGIHPFDGPVPITPGDVARMSNVELVAALKARGITRAGHDKMLRGLLLQALAQPAR